MNLLCLICIALSLLKCCLTQSINRNCDVEWERRGDHCYRIFSRRSVWTEAKQACEDEDATLPVIMETATAGDIQNMLSKLGSADYWIGLKNEKMDDQVYDWKWVTGKSLKHQQFLAWNNGQPQIPSDNPDFCAYTKRYDIRDETWFAKSCMEASSFICQKPLGVCPRGSYHVGNTCYFLGVDKVSWKVAGDRCRSRNAQLVMIKSERDQKNIVKFILKQLGSPAVWIGLSRDPNTKDIRWVDNTAEDYDYWNWFEPSSSYHCAEIRNGGGNKWSMERCDFKQQFICQTPAVSTTPSPTTAPPVTAWTTSLWDRRCPSAEWTFVPDTGSCYLVNPGPEYWINADSSCIQQNAVLTSILNQAEQDAILRLVSNDVAGYWIGMERGSPNKWRWIDDSPFAYFNFANDTDLPGTSDILGKLNANGTWEFVDEGKRIGYICKKSAVEQGTTLSPVTTTPNPRRVNRSCPPGWFLIFDYCFRRNDVSVTWNEAREACSKEGGDLASIGSATEAMLLSFWASNEWGLGNVWIGLRSNKTGVSGHQYFWSDQTLVTFTKWGTMTSGGDTHNCASLNFQERSNDWSVSNCLDRRPILCKSASIDALNSSTTEPSTQFCPSGFSLSNSKCLAIYPTVGTTRSEAVNQCARLGGYLVTILSKGEQMAVNLELGHKGMLGRRLWIGLKRVNNTWMWNETQAVQYDNWIYRDRNFTCASLITEIANYGQWTTDDCGSKDVGGYICEAVNNISTTTASPTTPNTRRCELGTNWKEIGDRCFSFYAGTRLKTWIEARADCLQRGGDLASIMDERTNRDLTQLPSRFYKEMWIGLNSRDVKDDYVWANIKDTVNYKNWAVNPPDSHNQIERCATYNTTDQKWSLLNCDVRRPYFCSAEKGATAPPTPTTATGIPTTPPACGDNWRYKYFNKFCYKVTTFPPTTWYSARDQCLKEGGDLASVLTDDEDIFLLKFISGSVDRAWTGFKSFGGSTDYKWSDGNVPTYFNWARARLTNTTGHHFCAYIRAADGFWYDLPCNQKLNFVCKRPSSDTTPVPQTIAPATPLPGNCPAEWRSAGDKCYRIFSDPGMQRDFDDSSAYCNAFKNGILASITSPIEVATLTAMMKNVNQNVWIGYKLDGARQWLWLDHSQTQITNWNQGQMGSNPRMKCAKMLSASESISSAGRWAAGDCAEKIGFTCMTLKSTDYATARTPNPTICPQGFELQGSVCYMRSSSQATWEDGWRICSSHKALLVSIYDTFEQNFVNSLIDPYQPDNGVWIGLSNLDDLSSFQWFDGYDMVYAKWNAKQPVSDVKKRCVFMQRTGSWIVDDCNTNRPFICAIRTGSSPTLPPANRGNCPRQWFKNDAYCYFIETGLSFVKVYNFDQAEKKCQSQGAELLSITTMTELHFIDTATEQLIGKNYVRYNDLVWIGMTIPADGDYFWTDSSPVDVLNWNDNEPKPSTSETCVAFNLKTRKWVTLQCSALGGYVCKMSRLGLDSATTLPTTMSTMSATTVSSELVVISDPPNIGFIDFLYKSKKNDGVVAGVSIVGIIVLAAVAFAIVWYCRSKSSTIVKPEVEIGFDNVYHYSTQLDQVEIKPAGAVNST